VKAARNKIVPMFGNALRIFIGLLWKDNTEQKQMSLFAEAIRVMVEEMSFPYTLNRSHHCYAQYSSAQIKSYESTSVYLRHVAWQLHIGSSLRKSHPEWATDSECGDILC
jgi:hypothetical protein